MSYPSNAEMELFRWVTLGDEHAARCLQTLTDVAHVWDDVVDGDHPLDRAALDWAFNALVLELPANPFYRQHRGVLEPLVQTAALNWRVATAIERDADAPKHVAYVLRSTYIDLVTQVALLIGGPDWAQTVCRQVRTLNHTETFDSYLTGLQHERCVREGN